MAVSTSRATPGIGTKIEFMQSGSLGEIVSYAGIGWTRGSYDATHMEVPEVNGADIRSNGQQIPSGLVRFKTWTVTIHFDSAKGLPVPGDPETINLVFKKRSAELVPAKLSATGWVSDTTMGLEVDAKTVATVTIDFTGNFEYTKPVLL